MPRLKALTTGTVPRFIDVVHNLDSSELRVDNVVDRLRARGLRLALFGDETWLKLFPGRFHVADGTSSFYTKDFVEVDHNVTRHLAEELDPALAHPRSRHWEALIMHYLGMDHIGHQHGPESLEMHRKLLEMDHVFETVWRSLERQEERRAAEASQRPGAPPHKPALLVLLSDHGMNRVGNHGGASLPEASALLLLARVAPGEAGVWRGAAREAGSQESAESPAAPSSPAPALPRREINQVDLAPTLGLLLGCGIPEDSVGRLIPEAFRGLPEATLRAGLRANAEQLARLLRRQGLVAEASREQEQQEPELAAALARALGDKPTMRELELAVALASARLLRGAQGGAQRSDELLPPALAAAVAALVVAALVLALAAGRAGAGAASAEALALALALGVHTVSLSSSSAIENEHATWFFLATSWLAAVAARGARRGDADAAARALAVAALLRLLRARLQIINFFALAGAGPAPLRVDEAAAVLVLPEWAAAPPVAAAAVAAWAAATAHGWGRGPGWRWRWRAPPPELAALLAGAALVTWLNVQPGGGDLARARAAYACVGALALCGRALAALELLMLLLHRPGQAGLLLLGALAQRQVGSLANSPPAALLAHWLLGQCLFFALGNSHLVSTVDIAGAYTGLSGYSQAPVGALAAVILLSGPLQALAHAAAAPARSPAPAPHMLAATAAARLALASAVLVALRHHLFVWSVFAPKWIYEAALWALQAAACAALMLRQGQGLA
jgi:ethanolaminephosphotransferase